MASRDLDRPAPPRATRQRAAIGSALGAAGGFLSAQQLHEHLRAAGDRVAERLAGAALVAGLRDLSRVGEAGDLAAELAEAAAADGAYSAELQFRAEALWAAMHADGALDEALRSASALLDRTAPADARALLVATLALARADTGALPAARELLDRRLEGQVPGYLGLLRARQGRSDAARADFVAGAALLREAADDVSLAVLLCGRAELEWLSKQAAAARATLQEAEAIGRAVEAAPGSELATALERVQALLQAAGSD